MAVQVNSASVIAAASQSTLTLSHTVPAGQSLLVIGIEYGGATTISSVTWDGSAATLLVSQVNTQVAANNNRRNCALYYVIAPTAKTADIVLTMSAVTNVLAISALNVSGSDTSLPFHAYSALDYVGGATAAGGSVTSSVGDVVIDLLSGRYNGTQDASQARWTDNAGVSGLGGGMSSKDGAASSTAMSWSFSATGTIGVSWIGASIRPAAGGGGAVSGSMSATESGADAAALSGAVMASGSLAASESGADTAALAGTVIVVGALAATESGSDSAVISGNASGDVVGSLAAHETGADAASIVGAVIVSGTVSAIEAGQDVATISGDTGGSVAGSLSASESGSDAASIQGAVLVSGAVSAAEAGGDVAAADGKVVVSGALDAIEVGSDSASMTSADTVAGSMAAAEDGADMAALVAEVTRILGARPGSLRPRDAITRPRFDGGYRPRF